MLLASITMRVRISNSKLTNFFRYWLLPGLIGFILFSGEISKAEVSLTDSVDVHAIFTKPITEGVFDFDENGFIPKEPIERIRKIHKEMIQTIQKEDFKKQTQYLLTLSNRAHTDLTRLKRKIIDELGATSALEIDKSKVKADAFILLTSHAALMGSAILYFPDIMNTMIAKNPEFSEVIKWVMNLSATNNFVDDQILMKLFKLVQQELGSIPKDPDYENPYKQVRKKFEELPPTTKKPRTKLPRGPRLSRGEL